MPLQVKCPTCGRTLVLEHVFQGARCLCKHCRSLVEVERRPSVTQRAAVRPERPPLASARVADSKAGVTAGRSRFASARGWIAARISVYRLAATTSILLAVMLGVVMWTSSGLRRENLDAGNPQRFAALDDDSEGVASTLPIFASNDPRRAIQENDPLRSYFGVPLSGDTVGCIVDSDVTMAPYIDRVAMVTNSVISRSPMESIRFGVVQPSDESSEVRLQEVYQSAVLQLEGRTPLRARTASGTTSLAKAFAVTESWYPEELFLVLSKPVSSREVDALTQLAEQSGAVTHVIALGAAANEPGLSRIAEATAGQYVRISDDDLNLLVRRHELASPVAPSPAESPAP